MLKELNHKNIGNYYLLLTYVGAWIGTILSIIIRTELGSNALKVYTIETISTYLLDISLHGLMMIFFVVMPGLIGGLGNSFIPLLIWTTEVGFPRINNMSLWVLLGSEALIVLSGVNEYGIGLGWTLYPPLSTVLLNLSSYSLDLIIYSLIINGISSSLSSVNMTGTILYMKAIGLYLLHLELYVGSIEIPSIILLVVLPILASTIVMILLELHYNTIFFDNLFGGDVVFYQHLFWFFGHPEVYILILPAFGVISLIMYGFISTLFAYLSMILALTTITIYGAIVWSHHLTTVNIDSDTRAYFTAITLLISLPTGSKIFNWISTYIGTHTTYIYTTSMNWTLTFLLTFTIGGSTGVILGNIIIDLSLHDTYYVVTHFHTVLSLGAILALLIGFLEYQTKVLNKVIISDTSSISRIHLLLQTIGIICTFLPLHFLGLNTMPRRFLDFYDILNSWLYTSTLGSYITIITFSLLKL